MDVSGRPKGCAYRRTDTSWPTKLRMLIIDVICELASARGKALLGSRGKPGEAEIGRRGSRHSWQSTKRTSHWWARNGPGAAMAGITVK